MSDFFGLVEYMVMNLFAIVTSFVLIFPELFKTVRTVLAQQDYDLRLVGGENATEGRVEIYYASQWGTICDDTWGTEESRVVCRQLGYDEGYSETIPKAAFGPGTGMIWLSHVSCLGNEMALSLCSHHAWGSGSCSHEEDVGVKCHLAESEGSLRLSDGKTANEGRIEIYHDGEWGTVCFNHWDMPDGLIACRQLGFAGIEMVGLPVRQGTGRIWLDEVYCTGAEQTLAECSHNGWGIVDCNHSDDAGVRCALVPEFGRPHIKLVGGKVENEGRVEVFLNGEWGSVCDDEWDMSDGMVACRQLGYSGVDLVYYNAKFGQAYGRIWLDDMQCSGMEPMLTTCLSGGLPHDCSHTKDAGVRCTLSSDEVTVRLMGGSSNKEGRLEVYHNNRWGTVCLEAWDELDNQVVCRQLGFTEVGGYFQAAVRGYGVTAVSTRPVHLAMVKCTGDEDRIEYCIHSGWGRNDCRHSEDVGVQCYVTDAGLSPGEIVGIVLGCLVVASLLCFCCLRGFKNKLPSSQHTAIPMEDVSREVAVDDVPVSREATPEPNNDLPEVDAADQPPPSYEDITKYKPVVEDGIHLLPSAFYPPPSSSSASVI